VPLTEVTNLPMNYYAREDVRYFATKLDSLTQTDLPGETGNASTSPNADDATGS
jgi:hypothetical protein